MSPGRAKPFVATATEDELSSLTRDVAASHSAQIDHGDMQVPIPASSSISRGSEDSINTGAGVLQEESSECKSSYMLPGTAAPPSSSNPPSPPEKAQTETETGWLRSQVIAEKEEKKVIQSKLDELNKRKVKLERRLFVKSKECEKLEKEAQSTQKELNDEQKKHDDALQELRARKDEINSLQQCLQVKDGELKLEQEKLRAKQERDELITVIKETSKRIRALKEDWKKDRREFNEVREGKSIIENYLSWTDKDVKYYKEVEKRMKYLERQRTVAVVAFVVVIIPLVLAHVKRVYM
jgi:hypothetical protein